MVKSKSVQKVKKDKKVKAEHTSSQKKISKKSLNKVKQSETVSKGNLAPKQTKKIISESKNVSRASPKKDLVHKIAKKFLAKSEKKHHRTVKRVGDTHSEIHLLDTRRTKRHYSDDDILSAFEKKSSNQAQKKKQKKNKNKTKAASTKGKSSAKASVKKVETQHEVKIDLSKPLVDQKHEHLAERKGSLPNIKSKSTERKLSEAALKPKTLDRPLASVDKKIACPQKPSAVAKECTPEKKPSGVIHSEEWKNLMELKNQFNGVQAQLDKQSKLLDDRLAEIEKSVVDMVDGGYKKVKAQSDKRFDSIKSLVTSQVNQIKNTLNSHMSFSKKEDQGSGKKPLIAFGQKVPEFPPIAHKIKKPLSLQILPSQEDVFGESPSKRLSRLAELRKKREEAIRERNLKLREQNSQFGEEHKCSHHHHCKPEIPNHIIERSDRKSFTPKKQGEEDKQTLERDKYRVFEKSADEEDKLCEVKHTQSSASKINIPCQSKVLNYSNQKLEKFSGKKEEHLSGQKVLSGFEKKEDRWSGIKSRHLSAQKEEHLGEKKEGKVESFASRFNRKLGSNEKVFTLQPPSGIKKSQDEKDSKIERPLSAKKETRSISQGLDQRFNNEKSASKLIKEESKSGQKNTEIAKNIEVAKLTASPLAKKDDFFVSEKKETAFAAKSKEGSHVKTLDFADKQIKSSVEKGNGLNLISKLASGNAEEKKPVQTSKFFFDRKYEKKELNGNDKQTANGQSAKLHEKADFFK